MIKLTGPQLKPLGNTLLSLDKRGIIPHSVYQLQNDTVVIQTKENVLTEYHFAPSGGCTKHG